MFRVKPNSLRLIDLQLKIMYQHGNYECLLCTRYEIISSLVNTYGGFISWWNAVEWFVCYQAALFALKLNMINDPLFNQGLTDSAELN